MRGPDLLEGVAANVTAQDTELQETANRTVHLLLDSRWPEQGSGDLKLGATGDGANLRGDAAIEVPHDDMKRSFSLASIWGSFVQLVRQCRLSRVRQQRRSFDAWG